MAKKNLSTTNLQGLGVNNAIAPVGQQEIVDDYPTEPSTFKAEALINSKLGSGVNANALIKDNAPLYRSAALYESGQMSDDEFYKDLSQYYTNDTVMNPTGIGTDTPTVPTNDSNDDAYQRALQETLANYQRAEQERAAALQRNYDNAVGQLRNAYNSNAQSLKANSDDALRQAYISYMLGQRGLNQQLANNGMTGGATESVLANLYNEYGGNRADIQKGLQNNLAQLQANYQNGLANLGANYGSNYADILADYYNQAASVNNSYATNLAKQLGKETATGDNAVSHSVERASVVNTLKGNANSPSNIIRYLNMLGDYTDAEKEMMLIEAGIDPVALTTQLGGTASNGATKDYTPTNTSGVTREDGTHIDGNGNVWDKDGNWVGKLG